MRMKENTKTKNIAIQLKGDICGIKEYRGDILDLTTLYFCIKLILSLKIFVRVL